jgi:hypothetical protein
LLAVASQGLKSRQDKNTSDKKMINILGAINVEASRDNAQEMFNKYVVESKIISGEDLSAPAFDVDIKKEFRDKSLTILDRNYPLYICEKEEKNTTIYIFDIFTLLATRYSLLQPNNLLLRVHYILAFLLQNERILSSAFSFALVKDSLNGG